MGIISKLFAWGQHPSIDTDTDPKDWAAFLALIVIASFLWSRVIKELVREI